MTDKSITITIYHDVGNKRFSNR